MTSVAEQTQIAVDYVKGLGVGHVELQHIAEDMTAWSYAMKHITRAEFLPRLPVMPKVFTTPLTMTIDSTVAQLGRVGVQCRSHGVLYNGETYGNEYLFLIEFNEAGQIRHAREYFNVDRLRDILMPAIVKYKDTHPNWADPD